MKKSNLKFGAIGVFGRANAGKSTLINALVGEEVSIVSFRPQTTRRRILGILTKEEKQIVFCDTPGLHQVKNKLDAFMNEEIHATLHGLQGSLYLVDVVDVRFEEDQGYLEQLKSGLSGPMALVLNKADLAKDKDLEAIKKAYMEIAPFTACFTTSADKKQGLDELLNYVEGILPEGPHAYDAEYYTSLSEREIAEEVVRQVALEKFYQEVPHSVAVNVEQFKDRPNGKTFIEANITVEKDSHKKIIIGTSGKGIKELGQEARQRLNRLLGRDIFLQLWIKVRENWRKKDEWVKRLGYKKR